MSGEKPQPGNPHQLTVRQHIHTAHAIGRFADEDGLVDVQVRIRRFRTNPRNEIFCAQRTWDERAEKGYMQKIENAYHDEIEKAISGDREDRDHHALTQYHLLWGLRHHYDQQPLQDTRLTGISGSGLSKNEEEIVESKRASFVRDDGVVPSRFAVGFKIQQRIDMHAAELAGARWGLVHAREGEFLVADCYGELALMPIAPDLCFAVGMDDGTVDRNGVTRINRASIEASSGFYFGRDLSVCPSG